MSISRIIARPRCSVWLLLSLCAASLVHTEAIAQWAIGLEVPWQSSIQRNAIERSHEALNLDSEQRAIVEILYRDHLTAVERLVREGREREKQWTDACSKSSPGSPQAFEAEIDRQRGLAEYAERIADLDGEFFESVSVVLREDQKQDWLAFRREMRDDRVARLASPVPGVHVNLDTIVTELLLECPRSDELELLLNDYSQIMEGLYEGMIRATVDFSREKWKRTRAIQKMNEQIAARLAQGQDPIGAGKRYSRAWRLDRRDMLATHVAARQMNETFAHSVAALLPPQVVEEFWDRYRQAKYPFAHPTTTSAHRFASEVRQTVALSSEQTVAIEGILQQVQDAIKPINVRAAAAEEESFRKMWREFMNEPGLESQMVSAREQFEAERNVIAEGFIPQIRALLIPEQLQALESHQGKNDTPPSAAATSQPR